MGSPIEIGLWLHRNSFVIQLSYFTFTKVPVTKED